MRPSLILTEAGAGGGACAPWGTVTGTLGFSHRRGPSSNVGGSRYQGFPF